MLCSVEFKSDAVSAMLDDILGGRSAAEQRATKTTELEISPELFERQDYMVIYFENEWDWNVACERLGVKTVVNATIAKTSTIRQRGRAAWCRCERTKQSSYP